MFACSGILFNHESPRRGLEFVTRKITDARRPRSSSGWRTSCAWATSTPSATGASPATTSRAMWLMLQQDEPDDYVDRHRRDAHACRSSSRSPSTTSGWTGDEHVVEDPTFIRPAEVDLLLGDAGKAREELGWQPEASFEQLVRMMVDADLEVLRAGRGASA